jgi:hypothetical protein
MKMLRSPFDDTPYLCVHCGRLNTDPLDRLEEFCPRCRRWKVDPTHSWDVKYVLVDKTPVPASLREWARMMEQPDARRVAWTETETTRVSTVFLGLDHNWSEHGPPLLFETMVFEREGYESPNWPGRELHESLDCARCSTWDEAIFQHDQAVEKVLEVEREALAKLKETVET